MFENERFNNVLDYLITNKKVRNQQQFVEEIQSDKATVSQIKNGKLSIPNDMFARIEKAFPYISSNWIKDGKGEMLKNSNVNNVNGNGNTAVAGNGNQITTSNISEMIELQKGYQEILKTSQGQLSESQTQISKLINIIEQLNNRL